MVSARVNELVTAAYGLWSREDATLEEMRVGFDGMCPGPPADATTARDGGDALPAAGVLMPPWADLTVDGFARGHRVPALPEAQRAVDRAGGFVRAHARATAAV